MTQRIRKAVTSGRIKGGIVVEGEVVLPPKKHKAHDFLPPLPDLRFDATPWNKSRKAFDDEVAALLLKIDVARRQLGCEAQAQKDIRVRDLIPRWAGAAQPTGAYEVLAA